MSDDKARDSAAEAHALANCSDTDANGEQVQCPWTYEQRKAGFIAGWDAATAQMGLLPRLCVKCSSELLATSVSEVKDLTSEPKCSVELTCEGGIFECQKYELEAEIERLKQLCEAIKTLESMNEDGYEKTIAKQREEIAKWGEDAQAVRAELSAARTREGRLVAALKRITGMQDQWIDEHGQRRKDESHASIIAREALAEGDESGRY